MTLPDLLMKSPPPLPTPHPIIITIVKRWNTNLIIIGPDAAALFVKVFHISRQNLGGRGWYDPSRSRQSQRKNKVSAWRKYFTQIKESIYTTVRGDEEWDIMA